MNKMLVRFGAAVAIAVLAVACAPAAPPDTTADDMTAVSALRSAWEAAYEAGDAAALAALYTEDATSMPAGEATVAGKAAIQATYQGMFDQMTFATDLRPLSTHVDGDLGYDHGEFAGTATPKAGGDATAVTGRYLVVFRRGDDGAWRLSHTMDNQATPPAAPMTGGQ